MYGASNRNDDIFLKGKNDNKGVDEVLLPSERSIKCSEGTHDRLAQNPYMLSGGKFGPEIHDETKCRFPPRSSVKAVLHGDATRTAHAIFGCPMK